MNNEILDKYGVTFIEKKFLNRLVKDVSSQNEFLSQFITDFNNSWDANRLVDVFDAVLNGTTTKDIVISPTLLTLDISLEVSILYNDPEYTSDTIPIVQIPTVDLFEIIKSWEQFLAQP